MGQASFLGKSKGVFVVSSGVIASGTVNIALGVNCLD